MKTADWFKSRRNLLSWGTLLVLFLLLAILVSVTSAIVISLFVTAVLLDMDCGIPLAIALVLLLVSALMLVVNQQGAAEVLANWAFYFFGIGVIILLIDYVRGSREETDEEDSVDA
jgi:uncharacterized membrane protein